MGVTNMFCRQRTANDSLQQQFVLQVEKISSMEKQLKQYRTEKLEYESKYEERVRIEVFRG